MSEVNLNRRSFFKGAALVVGAGAGAAYLSSEFGAKPESRHRSEGDSVASLLEAVNINMDMVVTMPVLDFEGRYRALPVKAVELPPGGRTLVENLGFRQTEVYNLLSEDYQSLPQEEKERVDKMLADAGAPDLFMAGAVLMVPKEGLNRLLNGGLFDSFRGHVVKRKFQDLQACEEGKIKGVSHRDILTFLVMGAAAAGALASHEAGLNGVTLQTVATGPGLRGGQDALNALFSIPPAALDSFLHSIGSSREALKLTNLMLDGRGPNGGNYVLRFVLERNGEGTAYFLSKEYMTSTGRVISHTFNDVLLSLKTGKTQYGNLVDLETWKANYLPVLAAARMLWQRMRKILGGDMSTICNKIGSEARQPVPVTKVPPTVENGQNTNETETLNRMMESLGYGWDLGSMVDIFNIQRAAVDAQSGSINVATDTGIVSVDIMPLLNPTE